jgi:cytochrome c oxidase cbb3-type subunit 3
MMAVSLGPWDDRRDILAIVNVKFLAVLALSSLCAGQDDKPAGNPFAGDSAAVETGRMLFRMSCAGCHGLHAKGGRSGPDLTRGGFSGGDSDADLRRVISNGVPGAEMPSFRAEMDDDDLWRLVSYVRSVRERGASAPITGNQTGGEKLFWGKGSCGQCHRVGTRGGVIGPDLSRAGSQRSLAYLRESVVKPDADVTDGYSTIVVVTREGRKIEGVEKGYDNFSARLIDLSGNFHSFMRDEVRSAQREYRSLMPSNYERLFSAGEMDDLLAYLASLRGER